MNDLKENILNAGGRAMPKNNPLWKELFTAYKAAYSDKSNPNRPTKSLPNSCSCRFTIAMDWILK